MKKILIPFLAVLTLVFTGCDDPEIIFDGAQTLAYFEDTSVALDVRIGTTETADLTVAVSTLSTSDRTVNVSVDEDSNVDAANYSFNTAVTIPANSYFGTLSITGIDTPGLPTTGRNLILNIENLDGGQAGVAASVTIRIAKVCPIPETFFVGNYLMEQVTAVNSDDGGQMFENQIVEIERTSETGRSFEAVYLEFLAIGNGPTTIPFLLSCGEILVENVSSTLLCVQGQPTIDFGPPAVPSTYSDTDDSVIEITITEYFSETGGCSLANGPYDTTFRFTKQ